MKNKAFCIHGHFYQPPRENPLTGEIPAEQGAAPFHDWNERIHDQCYRPNAVLGNFERISFNIGPTLLTWMEKADPHTLNQIIEQDRFNWNRYGVGNGMAQAYNHPILPLSARADKVIQVRWGIVEFTHRFGHKPSGMWLPETAVDLETLEILAEAGIEFTILAPWQVEESNLDFTVPYWVNLPGGKRIAVFFYNQDLSTRISFDPAATSNADLFIRDYLLPQFSLNGHGDTPALLLVASDGELYGHHQQFRDKFLAHLLGGAMENEPVETSFPALWLRSNPPKKAVHIRNFTSWSCHHGVVRWMGPCGCTTHGEWKAPFRKSLQEIARLVDEVSKKALPVSMINDWEALKQAYIHILLGNAEARTIILEHASRALADEEIRLVELLLRAQYEVQRCFTSCGWYFEDYDRIEPRNNTAYAAQAVWLVCKATGIDLSPQAMAQLKQVVSWRSGLRADVVFSQQLYKARQQEG